MLTNIYTDYIAVNCQWIASGDVRPSVEYNCITVYTNSTVQYSTVQYSTVQYSTVSVYC